MCGIFFLIRIGGQTIKIPTSSLTLPGLNFSPDADFLLPYRLNPCSIVADQSRTFTYSSNLCANNSLLISSEEIDAKRILKMLGQRGPDGIRGVSGKRENGQWVVSEIEVGLGGVEAVQKLQEALVEVMQEKDDTILRFIALSSVLSLRRTGEKITFQPLLNANILLQYNGEIFSTIPYKLAELQTFENPTPLQLYLTQKLASFDPQNSDTAFLFETFDTIISTLGNQATAAQISESISSFMQCLCGEYSLVLSVLSVDLVLVFKDGLGKRSLLVGSVDRGMIFSSALCIKIKPDVVKEEKVGDVEVKIDEVASKPVAELGIMEDKCPAKDQEATMEQNKTDKVKGKKPPNNPQKSQKPKITNIKPKDTVSQLNEKDEDKSLKKHDETKQNDEEEDNESPAALQEKYLGNYFNALEQKLIELPPNIIYWIKLQESSQCLEISSHTLDSSFKQLLATNYSNRLYIQPKMTRDAAIDLVRTTLKLAMHRIVQTIHNIGIPTPPTPSHNPDLTPVPTPTLTTTSKIAVLFSGGLDSTLLAHYLLQSLPQHEPIDLLSIAYSPTSSDRKCTLSSYNELRKLHPTRVVNLVLVDRVLSDVKSGEEEIYDRVYPQVSHLDFNIGAVLAGASLGEGKLVVEEKGEESKFSDGAKLETQGQPKDLPQPQPQPQTQIQGPKVRTGARIVLDGLGADELFGGYRRYRNSFHRGGIEEMFKEIQFDLGRIWVRNLGRDDRIISANSVECRFPFLDAELIRLVYSLDYNILTDFNKPRGEGDKTLLRDLAVKEGLPKAAGFAKKAMQFGTGIAKLSNISKFGSNRAAKGNSKYTIDG